MATITRPNPNIASGHYARRPALTPIIFALGFAWATVVAAFLIAINHLKVSSFWGLMCLLGVYALAFVLVFATSRWPHERTRRFDNGVSKPVIFESKKQDKEVSLSEPTSASPKRTCIAEISSGSFHITVSSD